MFNEIACKTPIIHRIPENQLDGETVCLKNRMPEKPAAGKSGSLLSTNSLLRTNSLLNTDHLTKMDGQDLKVGLHFEAEKAFNLFNAMARLHSWPLCQKRTSGRIALLKNLCDRTAQSNLAKK